MEDTLKDYIESQVGFIDDDLYYNCIKMLSLELITKPVWEDLTAYAETHRSDLMGQDAIDYVKMRTKLFEMKKEEAEENAI